MASSGKLEWSDLQLLLAVLRAGSLTRAAADSGISQPTIGRRLKALEERLDAPLFYRGPTGIEATPLARQFGVFLKPASDAMEQVTRLAARETEVPKTIRLTTTTTLSILLTENLRKLTPISHGICLDILATRDPADFLRRESDMALRLRRPPEKGPVRGRKLGVLGFAVYGPKQGKPRVTALEPLRCIGLSDNRPPPHRQWFDAFVAERRGIIVARVGEVYLRLAAAREGIGATLLPCILGDRDPALTRLTPPVAELAEDIYLLIHNDVARMPAVREVASNLAQFITENRLRLTG